MKVRIRNDEPETWAPAMPKEDDEQTPQTRPTRELFYRDNTPIEERACQRVTFRGAPIIWDDDLV